MKKHHWVSLLLLTIPFRLFAQDTLQQLVFDQLDPFRVKAIITQNAGTISLPEGQPLFSLLIDSVPCTSGKAARRSDDTLFFVLAGNISCRVAMEKDFNPGVKYTIHFRNDGTTSRRLENLVPMGEGKDRVFITASGSKEWPGYLCRSKLHRPGYGPVGVVLPDNAWHMGFTDLEAGKGLSMVSVARRGQRDKENTEIDRWKITLKPGGWAEYVLYADVHTGDWHEGLRMMFHDRWLYDLKSFDNSMFKRKDLGWMKSAYIMLLQFAWDKKYYDYLGRKYTWYDNLGEYDSLTGGFDIYTLWPTWPRLGLDQRNQWDMYRDLPGGLAELKKQSDHAHSLGKRYFISFNPWDEGTRKEDQLKGMEELLRATDADGVVLDTRGESSRELQAAADRVKPGIIMYSEGMAVPKDMPGIVSGRVHDALVMPPPLNLNKLIKPDFAIFRVLQLADDRLHRELAIAFFNGYGVEINTMRPGRPEWIGEEFAYMGRTTRILRENNSVFHNDALYPLVPTRVDSVYVNRWQAPGKTVYTIYSVNPLGCDGLLFDAGAIPEGYHVVDLWNHLEIIPVKKDGSSVIPVNIAPFDRKWLNSRREGNAGCIAVLPKLLKMERLDDRVIMNIPAGRKIVFTSENPGYNVKQYIYPPSKGLEEMGNLITGFTGKVVIQLFDSTELADEIVLVLSGDQAFVWYAAVKNDSLPPAKVTPKLISNPVATPPVSAVPEGMAAIPAGPFRFYTKRDPGTLDPFIPFPDFRDTVTLQMPPYYMDITPVTNAQYQEFLLKSGFSPPDTTGYLRHWNNGYPVKGTEKEPVVHVNLEDAAAYCRFSGKRLPTEQEWQYAAQGTDMRKYPWGNQPDSTRCNFNLNLPTAVDKFPGGASPYGILDMIGNVWQMTSDVYDNGSYFFNIIRGGSYYHPTQSIWYVTGGPLPADHPEMLLLIAPGLDRNATVGFRCAKDVGK